MNDSANDRPHLAVWSPVVLACLGATWFLWATKYLAIKWALVSFPPFCQMGSQFVVAGTVLALAARARGSTWPTSKEWVGGAIMGTLLISGGYGFTVRNIMADSDGQE